MTNSRAKLTSLACSLLAALSTQSGLGLAQQHPDRHTPYAMRGRYSFDPASYEMHAYMVNLLKREEHLDAHRFNEVLRRQVKSVKNEIKSLKAERRQSHVVTNGAPSSFPRVRRFHQLAQRYADSPEVYSQLNAPVPALPAADFRPRSVAFEALIEGGYLRRMPYALASSTECRTKHEHLRRAWSKLWSEFSEGCEPSYASITAFRSASREFIATAEQAMQGGRYSSARHLGAKRIKAIKALAGRIHDADFQATLVKVMANGALHFEGGTMRDLMSHLNRHQLTIGHGSAAQWELNELGGRIVRHIDSKIAANEEKLEFLKKQHHWSDWVGPWNGQGMERGSGGSILNQSQAAMGMLTARN